MILRRCLCLLLSALLVCGSSGFFRADAAALDQPIGVSMVSPIQGAARPATIPVSPEPRAGTTTNLTGYIDYQWVQGQEIFFKTISSNLSFSGDLSLLPIVSNIVFFFPSSFLAGDGKKFHATLNFPFSVTSFRISCRDIDGFWTDFFIPPDCIRYSNGVYSINFEFLPQYDFDIFGFYVTDISVSNLGNTSFSLTNATLTDAGSKGWMSGFFSNILGGIKTLVDGIVNLPQNIANSISGFFTNLGNRITSALTSLGTYIIDGIKSLFVPADGYFATLFTRLNTFFADRFGMLYFPIEEILKFLNRLLTLTDQVPSLVWPEIAFQGHVIMARQVFTFDVIYNNPTIKELHDLYLVMVDVIIMGWVVNLLYKKYLEVMG